MADPHHAPTDYQRGTQEISEQQATFALFMGLAKWGSLAVAASLTFLTIWFMPGGSFFAGFLTAAVLSVAGFFFLKSSPKH